MTSSRVLPSVTGRARPSSDIIDEAIALRQALHREPEVSNREAATARHLVHFLARHGLAPLRTDLGGHGLLYHIDGGPGRPVLFRADLDALPLLEQGDVPHRSTNQGLHHACGHDGHMAMLAGALVALQTEGDLPRPVYALFQPAEEEGTGAAAVLQDPLFDELDLAAVFAIHNLPRHPLGQVVVRPGPMAVASTGLHYRFDGATSHAASPHEGLNPIPTIATFLLRAMGAAAVVDDFRRPSLVTPIHVDAGQPAFGTSAGTGDVRLTVRAADDATLSGLVARLDHLARTLAAADGLHVTSARVEPFPATHNDRTVTDAVLRAAQAADLEHRIAADVMPWSEDFGHFTARWPGALVGLGAGPTQPDLHTPHYDFPDALVPLGIRLWRALVAHAPA